MGTTVALLIGYSYFCIVHLIAFKIPTMDLINFFYRNKTYSCNCYMDIAIDPCFIFVEFFDKNLIMEFGEEVTIKTDCFIVLPKNDDYAELIKLRQAVFNVFKTTPEFMVGKNKRMLWDDLQKHVYNTRPASKKNTLEA